MTEKSLTLACIAAAITASLCCIGPLVAVVLGLGTFGAAAVFEKFRPLLLGITVVLLAGAFYLAYRPKKTEHCQGATCQMPSSGRYAKAMLWLAAVFVVLFAAFPYYSPLAWKALAQIPREGVPVATPLPGSTLELAAVKLSVTGMTCAGCAANVQSALLGLKGIAEASVSLEEKSATVKYDSAKATTQQMIEAIEKAGYSAALAR